MEIIKTLNGVYLCTPKLDTGFVKEKTRYITERDGNLIPGNWILKAPEEDWYDYKNQIPKVVFWENYWGNGIINKIRINDELLKSVYKYKRVEDGIFIRLQDKPINVLDSEHVELQKKVNSLIYVK